MGLEGGLEKESIPEQSACPSVRILGSSPGQKQARGSAVGQAAERTQLGRGSQHPETPRCACSRFKSLLGAKRPVCQLGKKIFIGPFLTSEGLGPSASPAAPAGPLPALTTPCPARASHRCPSQPQKCLGRERFSFPACTESNLPSAACLPRGRAGSRVNRDAQAGLPREVRLSCQHGFCLQGLETGLASASSSSSSWLPPRPPVLLLRPQDLLIPILVSPHLRHAGVTEQQAAPSAYCISVKAELRA